MSPTSGNSRTSRGRRPPKTPVSKIFSHGWFVALIVLGAAGFGALIYARSAAGLVFYRLLTDGLLSIVWMVSSSAVGSALLSRILKIQPAQPANEDVPGRLLYWVTAAALGMGLLGLIALCLGLAGWLNRATTIAVLGVPLVWALLQISRMIRDESASDARAVSIRADRHDPLLEKMRASWQWLWLAVTPFLAVALVGTMTPPGVLWTPEEPHGFDVIEYHLQGPREWYEAGRILPLQHNVFTYLPMGAEMHYLLAMHLEGGPWEGMYLAQLMHLWMIVLTVLALAAIACQIAPSPASAVIAPVALAATPWFAQLGPIAYNDGALLVLGTLGVGWAMLGLSAGAKAVQFRYLLIAGLLTGFACGVKLTAVPELLLAIPIACLASGRLLRRRSAVGALAVFLIGAILVFAPWLVRNAAWTGNPLFPEAANLLGKAHWSATQVTRWRLANHEPGGNRRTVAVCLQALWNQVLGSWQFGYVLLPLSFVALIILLLRRMLPSARKPPYPLSGAADAGSDSARAIVLFIPPAMLLFLLIFWMGFTHLQGRFFLLAAPLAAMLIAQVNWGKTGSVVVTGVILVVGAIGFVHLNSKLTAIIWRKSPDGSFSLCDTLGRQPLQWLTPNGVEDANAQGKCLTLVGDSRPFLYQMPMSWLRYRTIFDLDTSTLGPSPSGPALINAWAGRPADAPRPPGEYLLIDASELMRFHKTYFDVPVPPAWPLKAVVVPPPGELRALPGEQDAGKLPE